MGFDGFLRQAVCNGFRSVCPVLLLFCCFNFCTPLNRGAGAIFLVVCDNDERTARRRSASELVFRQRTLQARSQGVNQKLRNGFVDIAVPY